MVNIMFVDIEKDFWKVNFLVKIFGIFCFLILFFGLKWERVFKIDLILYDNFVRDNSDFFF